MSVHIEWFASGPLHNNTYLVMSTSSEDAVVIDPGPQSANRLIDMALSRGKTVSAIWITHSHWDHIADCSSIAQQCHAPIMAHRLDIENLLHPGSDGLALWVPVPPVASPTPLNDGDMLHVGPSAWRVIHTPGHSPGSICLYNSEEGILFSGDTLFHGTMGNCSFPTSSPFLMGQTLEKLCSLPPETRVFPGHGLSTTIGNELSWMRLISQKLQQS